MYHVVIDLEMCRVPRRSSADYRCRMETIQIGAVLLDGDFVRIGTLSEYVNPSYGAIDSCIWKLIQKLELDPAFELTAGYVPLVSDAPLSCIFGDLLAKMQIKVG